MVTSDDIGPVGIFDGDPGFHQPKIDATAHDGGGFGQLYPVVDANVSLKS
jgi:hypothetical protein